MKRNISILLIFMLLASTMTPFPLGNVVYAVDGGGVEIDEDDQDDGNGGDDDKIEEPPAHFTATVPESVVGESKITVTNITGNPILKLFKEGTNEVIKITENISTNSYDFENVAYGRYYVTETIAGKESIRSAIVEVRPGIVTISQEGVGPNEILVTGAESGAKLILYNDRTGYIQRETEAGGNGIGRFTEVSPGTNYRVRQVVNNIQSPLSEGLDIRPEPVEATASATAGSTNDQGTISVIEAESGAIIRLYDAQGSTLIASNVANSSGGYMFNQLKAGTYTVTQFYNGIESLHSDPVTIGDGQAPVITLNGPSEVRIIVGQSYVDEGANVTDNIDSPWTILKGDYEVTSSSAPGIYEIKYVAEDTQGNTSEVIRRVIVSPEKNELVAGHTDPNNPNSVTGNIEVTNVFPGSTLYLYQDPNGVLIREIIEVNENNYTIQNVPVGEDYYVIQEFRNENGSVVRSEPSERTDVEDKTPPVLQLNGAETINLIVGEQYIEYGARATDNIDNHDELTAKINITHDPEIDTSTPGVYKVTYNVTDNAGNPAKPITRTVNVKPGAVITIGSTADLGEVGVRNALPGATLQLYRADDTLMEGYNYTLQTSETTHVFKNVGPGSYYVKQSAGGFDSAKSNVVEVVDIDRPHILLEGAETMTFVWGEIKKPYYDIDGTKNVFTDPGAIVDDYLKEVFDASVKVNGTEQLIKEEDKKHSFPSLDSYASLSFGSYTFQSPGLYTFTYNVTADRGATAIEKSRTVIVEPPAVSEEEIEAGKSSITVTGNSFKEQGLDLDTEISLYDAYHALVDVVTADDDGNSTFENVPAGIGYYVTQTVNGIESGPSASVNVTIYEEAKEHALITSFSFSGIQASAVIDQNEGTIAITVPHGTDVKNLRPVIEPIENVTTGPTISGNFTNNVQYIITNGETSKTYTVTVTVANGSSNVWKDTVNKNMTVSLTSSDMTLTPAEKATASEKGMSFLAEDTAIHVPAVNVKETSHATLTVRKRLRGGVTNLTDPAWRTSLSNIMEVSWGEDPTYLQPIEVELPNPEKKQFAKLIREDGKLYAVIQPSETVKGDLVGLITEPGMYALVDNVSKPIITSTTTANGETSYRLRSSTAGASIYYMTNSSQVSFDRSAQKKKNPVSSYTFIGLPNLADWTKYEGGSISIPGDELYAIAVHNQMISPISGIEQAPATQWKSQDIPTVPRHKVWTVTLNAKIAQKSLYTDSIYVTDDATGEKVETTLQASADGKKVFVSPVNAYRSNGQYTLWIDKQIKGNTTGKSFLTKPTKLTFKTK